MMRRWYPESTPPSGAELWKLLQEEIDVPKSDNADWTDGGKSAVGSIDYNERKACALARENRELRQQLAAAHELISRSANIYLRYYRARHRVLLWWRRTVG